MSSTARMLTLVAVLVGLATVLMVSAATAQRRPVIGVLSPFVGADSTFLLVVLVRRTGLTGLALAAGQGACRGSSAGLRFGKRRLLIFRIDTFLAKEEGSLKLGKRRRALAIAIVSKHAPR
jgi:hypothetical protein